MVKREVSKSVLAVVSCLCAGLAWSQARVELFSPSGYAKDARQVTVRFSEAMVALGEPNRSDPFAVECEVPGNGRWVDERNWVYDFDYDVPGAVRCGFSLRDDVRTVAGETVAGLPKYTFHTGGPAILRSEPSDRWGANRWRIDERQVFLLTLDAIADPVSIREHARCKINGTQEALPVDVVQGPERTAILDALELSGAVSVYHLVRAASNHLPAADERETRERVLLRTVMVRCRDALPAGRPVQLVWGGGIAGLNGMATTTDHALSFSVRPSFRAHLGCTDEFEGQCVGGIHIRFTAPVRRELAAGLRLVDQNGDIVVAEVDDESQIDRIDFPKAFEDQASYRAELVAPITDVDGRPLANASSFPATIRLGRLPPGASFGSGVRVIEHAAGAVAPVLLRRVTEPLRGRKLRIADDSDIVTWMRRVEIVPGEPGDAWIGSVFQRPLSEVNERGDAFTLHPGSDDHPYRLAGVPLAGPGFHVVQLELPAASSLPHRYVTGLILVTDLAVHIHRGKQSSLVWVTGLSDGQPVDGADIAVTDACTGEPVARAVTDADGLAQIPDELPWRTACANFRYLVSARKDGDLGVATSGGRWDRQPRPSIIVHAILDRALYQPGETVSMKLIVRLANAGGLALPVELGTQLSVAIEHYGTDETQETTTEIGEGGSAIASFRLPANAKLGWYGITADISGDRHWLTEFRVERFRVGTMRATIDGPDGPIVSSGTVPIALSVDHLAGGGAASLPVSLRTSVRPWRYYWEDGYPPEPRTTSARLDPNGKAKLAVGVPHLERRSALDIEMDYRDANGQRKTASKRIELWPAAIALDVQSNDTRSDKQILVQARGLDGSTVPGIPVEASIYYPRDYEERRLPGGYRTRMRRSESRLLASCSGRTDATGSLGCDVPEDAPDSVVVEATGWDEDGNAARTIETTGYWSSGGERKWLDVESKRTFAVGESVPIALDLPFDEATVLATVHREGVLAAFVEPVKGPRAVVNVPVQRNYAPNVDVTVLAIQPRVGPAPLLELDEPRPVEPEFTIPDAHRPAFRLGTESVRVGTTMNALSVVVAPDRDTYHTRDHARVRIAVSSHGGQPRPDAEVALAAVDEGLLELWPNETWDILKAMMAERYTRVDTSTSMRLLARTFGFEDYVEEVIVTGSFRRESGFGGGRAEEPTLRERFDALLLWNASVAMDDQGRAEVDVPLNDLLTSFRIVAVATAGEDLFGTGEATIRTTQNLILNAGLPELVREGDQFDAVFTVRNASNSTSRIDVEAHVDGLGKLSRKRLRLRPGQSREVSWPVTVPVGMDALDWEVTAKARTAGDRLAARQSVQSAVPVRVQQATLTQLATPREWPVKPPDKALPGRGGIKVSLQPSLANNLGSVREAMARYRYSCLEQDVSVAIVLGDEARWSRAMDEAEASLDSDGLLRFFPSDRLQGSPVLTAYVLSIADAAGKRLPDDLRGAMIEGLGKYVSGRIARTSAFPAADDELRELAALAALARYGALERGRLDAFEVNVEALPTSGLLDWLDVLTRVLPPDERLTVAKDALRARLNLQGTTMGFSTEHRDRLSWLMVATDGNAARAILSLLDDPDWQADLPRMIRGLYGRQHRGRWQTTVANAWGSVATAAFRAVFEGEPVTGTSTVRLGEVQQQALWPNPRDEKAALPKLIEIPWSAAQTLALTHDGTGVPWGMVEFRAAVPLTEPTQRGYRIVRRVDAVDRKRSRTWSRGDVAQIVLEIDANADMGWVVVDDPLPPGAVVLGSGLGGDSSILSATHVRGDRWPVFTERGFDSYRAYYDYVPKGRTTLRYNVRYNTAGTFQLPPSHVEAMYAPEMHADVPVKTITVR